MNFLSKIEKRIKATKLSPWERILIVVLLSLNIIIIYPYYSASIKVHITDKLTEPPEIKSKRFCDQVFRFGGDNLPAATQRECRTTEDFCKNVKIRDKKYKCQKKGWE
ncbi:MULTISPECIES: hypothetical protein [Nostocales]|uniref:Uncharacterized protein n=3 Tax=Nostocales TaxID=1161 RepID=A0A0C1RLJ8_9CYAN|nr:hypothetical protein [Tolypothrix bouteillei]KAF3888235.1 hypothetical protein DA73_0400024135 [Tolypothrix bouteillei VB521301]